MKQFKLHDHHFTDTATPGVRLRLYATFFFGEGKQPSAGAFLLPNYLVKSF